jgi:site-specific recombinase XerD
MPKYKHGSGSVYRRGKTWWMTYYVNGKQVWESTGKKDRTEARKALQAKLGQRAEGTLVVGAGKVTFEGLLDLVQREYQENNRKTIKQVRQHRKHLAKCFVGRRASEITIADILAFRARRQTEGAANAEINRETSTLRRGFNLALEAELLFRMPRFPKRLEESPPRAGFFEAEELQAILPYLPELFRAPVSFAYLTGWRFASEVLVLPWRNVDFGTGTVRLDMGSTKNKEGRLIYMTVQLRALLEEQREKTLAVQRESGQIIPFVFHKGGQRMAKYDRVWQQACQGAGLPGKIVHDFRRPAVRNMVRAGIPERVAMQMAGHKTWSVFDRYHIVSDGDLQEAAQRLEQAFLSQTMTKTMTAARLTPSKITVNA